MRPSEWTTFVQAGLNDIDRRCDAYLGWVDNKRRWREPILKQLLTTSAATAAIMGLTGVGATPIAIVGTAFGLAQDSFVNISSRLLTEIDHSVIQQVVLGNQNQFRIKLIGVPVDNRPAAIYLLRNYLRICMPFSIEMSINSTIATYHRAGAQGLAQGEQVLTQGPSISRATTASALIRSIPSGGPRGPLEGTDKNRPRPLIEPTMTGGSTDSERDMPKSRGESIQANLCVVPNAAFDPATREAIRQAKVGGNQSSATAAPFANNKNQIMSSVEAQIFLGSRPCSFDMSGTDRGYQTAFEKFRFADDGGVRSLQRVLAACDATLKESGRFDGFTRTAIKVAKSKLSPARKADLTDLETDTLNDRSFRAVSLTCTM
jgi:hypothetical protein